VPGGHACHMYELLSPLNPGLLIGSAQILPYIGPITDLREVTPNRDQEFFLSPAMDTCLSHQ
jgi:hypothetical protein